MIKRLVVKVLLAAASLRAQTSSSGSKWSAANSQNDEPH
jgi:hypothetical protein